MNNESELFPICKLAVGAGLTAEVVGMLASFGMLTAEEAAELLNDIKNLTES